MIMKNSLNYLPCCFFFTIVTICNTAFSQNTDAIPPLHKVTLPEAHIGDLNVDTKLLDSYEILPNNIRQFYLDARAVFSKAEDVNFTHPQILNVAKKHRIPLMGGPLLGNLKEDGIVIWLRPSTASPIVVKVTKPDSGNEKVYIQESVTPGLEQRMEINGLTPNTDYQYVILIEKQKVANGSFKTAPVPDTKDELRLVFGSCFHKIGLHNPNLANQIVKREPRAMMILGDIAVDDRENNINMHRSDYLLRDVSIAWQRISANIPVYTSWDDHDYLNDDLSGIPEQFNEADIEKLRQVWRQSWNNPENVSEGIYFNTRIGSVELIMLDTRSCRTVEARGQYGSYLGLEQQRWLKETLVNSTAPFKVVSSGTMWSDYISNGKDSWGTWDTLAREEIFSLIEKENISGVLFISGDRHGARGFTLPRPTGNVFYEFEAATLGGVPGPNALATDTTNQLFGYHGSDVIAFGEFTFNTKHDSPVVTFRLIDEFGNILEEHVLSYNQLTPISN